MDEATWAAGREPSEMLNFLRTSGRGSARKLRLVCCAVCRAVEHLLTDERYRRALDLSVAGGQRIGYDPGRRPGRCARGSP
jgi:hypothetical protein